MKAVKDQTSSEIIGGSPCICCSGTDFRTLFSAGDFDSGKDSSTLTKCKGCGLVRTEPMLTDTELSRYYDLGYYGGKRAKFVGFAERLTRWFNSSRARSIVSCLRMDLMPSVGAPYKVLDIGCGRGSLLKALNRLGCECHGVERTEFPDDSDTQDIYFHKGGLQGISFARGSFDAVVIWHVLEHTENPLAILQETSRVLRPGGILVIAVPSFGSFQSNLFRGHWFHLDLPRHLYHFTLATLTRCLNKAGFEVLHKSTFSLEQNPFGFVQSLFNSVMPSTQPNRFYSLLKKRNDATVPNSMGSVLYWSALACIASPFALFEHLVSGVLGKGATLIVYAKKH